MFIQMYKLHKKIKKNENVNYIFKMTSLVISMTTLVLIIIIYLNPHKSYEINPYHAISRVFWYLLVINFVICILALYATITMNSHSHINPLIFLILLVINRLLVQWVLFIRGTVTLYGDHMTHVGYIRTIVQTGHTFSGDYYPLTHILIGSVAIVSGTKITSIMNYGTALLSLFSVFIIYLVTNHVLPSINLVRYIVLIIGISVLFNRYLLYMTPNGWSILLLPLYYLLLFDKKESCKMLIPFSILVMILPMLHPLTSLYFMLLMGIYTIMLSMQKHELSKRFLIVDMILLISFITWIFNFQRFYPNIRVLFFSILTGKDPWKFTKVIQEGISKLQLTVIEFLKFIIFYEGHIIILVFLGAYSFYIFMKNKEYKNWERYLKLTTVFFIFEVILVIYGGTIFGILPGGSAIVGQRTISYTSTILPILITYIYSTNKSPSNKAKTLVTICILMASILSLFALLPSEKTYEPSTSITLQESTTWKWFFTKNNRNYGIFSLLTDPHRFQQFLFGYHESTSFFKYTVRELDHFKDAYVKEHIYIIISKRGKTAYLTVWSATKRFLKEDFVRIYVETHMMKIYTSSENDEVWTLND